MLVVMVRIELTFKCQHNWFLFNCIYSVENTFQRTL